MVLRIPIGINDFRKLREAGPTYVDKSQFICESRAQIRWIISLWRDSLDIP